MRLIHRVSLAGKNAGISVSLCGEMAADPRYTWVLVGLGVRELSMHPSAIPVIKNIIRGSSLTITWCAWFASRSSTSIPMHLAQSSFKDVCLKGFAPNA